MDQTILIFTLAATLVLFVWGKWRFDVVALMAMLFLVWVEIIPAHRAFLGFGHPAVITVVAVFILSAGLQNSGVVTWLTRQMRVIGDRPILHLCALTLLVTVLSGFMNNVGALAILMPVAIQISRKMKQSPALYLMPLAFGSLLGGMTTLIGTPPNIIIASFREEVMGVPFEMFDFSWVGVGVAFCGFLFISLLGWRLIPVRKGQGSQAELFEIEKYVTELKVAAESKFEGKTVDEFESIGDDDVVVLGIVRKNRRMPAPSGFETLQANDVLIVEVDPDSLESVVHTTGFEIVPDKELEKEIMGHSDVRMMEAIVMQDSNLIGKTARGINLRYRFGVNLLAVARQGVRVRARFHKIRFRLGDILLLRGSESGLQEALTALGCLPLAERGVRLGQKRILLGTLIFAGALAATAMHILPAQISFMSAAVLMLLGNIVTLRQLYSAIDWPVVVLLGAMIPVGHALETTGAASRIAEGLLLYSKQLSPMGVLAVILLGTMFLSDLVNNAAAALLMAPIAVRVAQGLSVSVDPFLMAVAIGASCAFLTPIGHQSSALVMGPGGYRFGDYWRVGLPLEILITIVSLPLLAYFWPF